MTVGFYAPLPPTKSGVADYAAALLRALPKTTRINVDGDINLYHLGNNQLHREIYRKALDRPGVIVLHDAVLHHFHLGLLGRQEYIDEFVYCYGGWYRGLAETLWEGRSRSVSDERYFRWSMLKRVAERARTVIVHNEGAAAMVRREASAARVEVIPHLLLPAPDPDPVMVERWRASRGIRPSDTLFGLMGYLRPSKRVMGVMRAFARLRAMRDDVWLLVAGEIGSSELERAMVWGDGTLREPYLDEVAFQTCAAACDAGVNLRYPGAGESSGMTARWMRLARPVVVSGTAENAALPLAGCPRVAVGAGEEEGLLALLLWLAESPVRRRECGSIAREWAGREMKLETIAARYWAVLAGARG